MKITGLVSFAFALFCVSLCKADPWLAPGDLGLRHDIELLADAGVIRAPVTTWPMSWPDIARDVLGAGSVGAHSPGVVAALIRVQRAARRAASNGFSGWDASVALAADPLQLRTFNDTPREESAASVNVSWLGNRWAANLRVSAVADADDDQTLRLDGSYIGFTLANFMISAGAMERWWGPGWEGSLILSNNARPIAGITVERNYTDAFKWPVLRWLGPWRASLALGRDEGRSEAWTPAALDDDTVALGAAPLPVLPDVRFLAARLNFRPASWFEFGLSRTAQWCGEGRDCDLETFGNLLIGRDNSGTDDSLAREEEPGNQLAGYDLRLRSPWKPLPVALYVQAIGEDEAGGLPSKFLGLLGLETWGDTPWGSYRLHGEYADSSCNFSHSTPEFGCAYRNSLYPQGYTYRGRVIGHAMDNDGRMSSLGVLLVRPSGETWNLLVRRVTLNRDGSLDMRHSVSPQRETLKNLALQYNRAFAWGELRLGAGLNDHGEPARQGSDAHGFLEWRQGF